jgi:hypothetical protein
MWMHKHLHSASDMDSHDVACLLRKQQCQAKICYLWFEVVVKQNIGCFDVSVDDFGLGQRMQVV